MRQYIILYKRGQAKEFGRLKPIEHKGLYDRKEVREAIDKIREQPAFEAICVRLGDELFNIVSFEQEAAAPDAFEFFEQGVLYTVGPNGAPVPRHY